MGFLCLLSVLELCYWTETARIRVESCHGQSSNALCCYKETHRSFVPTSRMLEKLSNFQTMQDDFSHNTFPTKFCWIFQQQYCNLQHSHCVAWLATAKQPKKGLCTGCIDSILAKRIFWWQWEYQNMEPQNLVWLLSCTFTWLQYK